MNEEKFQVVRRGRQLEDIGCLLRKRWLWCVYGALTVSLMSVPTPAQDAQTTVPPAPVTTLATPDTIPQGAAASPTENAGRASDSERLDRLEQMNEALKAQLTRQDERITELAKQNESFVTLQEETTLAEMESLDNNDLLIYGFADVQWYKFLLADDCWYKGYWNENNSFTVGHWNTYFEKRLSNHFRFLGEVRFLFQPYGSDTAFEQNAQGEMVSQHAQTGAVDWVDGYGFNWGGISIQRLWMEYRYNDYIGIRVGNFLTPWGIWNVDHASSVVIPGHRPYIVTAQLIPESQTGLLLFGSLYPTDTVTLEYALSLSNGRGPGTKIYDLDENKALGLKLSFQYEGPVSLGLGTYLYMGKYTDLQRVQTYTVRLEYDTDLIEQFKEKSIAVHLKFEWNGLLLQAEYARGLIQYTDEGRYTFYEENAQRGLPATYLADYIQQGAYGLMAYRLPFKAINLTPYFLYEYQEPRDLSQLPLGHNFGGGLNWRITPDVVWKVDYVYHRANSERWNIPTSRLHFAIISTQLAVNF